MTIDSLFHSGSLINSLNNEQYARLSIVSYIGVFPVAIKFSLLKWLQLGENQRNTQQISAESAFQDGLAVMAFPIPPMVTTDQICAIVYMHRSILRQQAYARPIQEQ